MRTLPATPVPATPAVKDAGRVKVHCAPAMFTEVAASVKPIVKLAVSPGKIVLPG